MTTTLDPMETDVIVQLAKAPEAMFETDELMEIIPLQHALVGSVPETQSAVIGVAVGVAVGAGVFVGAIVGECDGFFVGADVGGFVGACENTFDGCIVGYIGEPAQVIVKFPFPMLTF